MNWALFNPRAAISSPIQLCLYCAVPLCRQDSLSLDTVGHPLNTTLHNHSSLQTLWTHCAPFYSLLLWVAILQQETSLRDRHPDLTVTSIVRPNQAVTIVTQYVWIYALRHLDSHFVRARSAGMFQKRNPVCWQCGDPWGTGGFCDVQFQPQRSYGTTGSMGSPKGDRPWLKDSRDTRGPWRHWTDKPRGLLSDRMLLRLSHGENGERFNLNLF